ncbi:MAG TPA: MmcQ/YjbR family DNA-binding protein [Acidimicrobiales bacterium]|nr:MmcQ/YjbR family DNA-binding protein [Acidimicrobiales bacterium]
MDFDDVIRIGAALPEVEASTSYGTPALKVRGKAFCRLWAPDEQARKGPDVEGEVLVVFVDLAEKRAWIETSDGALFDQAHYQGHGAMLVKLAEVDEDLLADVLEQSYRLKAPRTLLRRLDEAAPT